MLLLALASAAVACGATAPAPLAWPARVTVTSGQQSALSIRTPPLLQVTPAGEPRAALVRGAAPQLYSVCHSVPEHVQFRVSCIAPSAPGAAFTAVASAHYGTPVGTCAAGNLAAGSCASRAAVGRVTELCVGKTTCLLAAENAPMGGDPCPFTRKRLAVTLVGTCSHVRIEQSDPMCGLGYPCSDAVVGGGAGAAVKLQHRRFLRQLQQPLRRRLVRPVAVGAAPGPAGQRVPRVPPGAVVRPQRRRHGPHHRRRGRRQSRRA